MNKALFCTMKVETFFSSMRDELIISFFIAQKRGVCYNNFIGEINL